MPEPQRTRQPDPPAPVSIALVVCDNVYTDRSGKRALIGLFDRINAARFPARHPKLCVFVSMTEVPKATRCCLEIVNAETEEPIGRSEWFMPEAVDAGPIATHDLVFELHNVVFPAPGTYIVRFLGNNAILAQRRMSIDQTPRPRESSDDDEN